MARRSFKLPAIQDLSKEQEDARALSKLGPHLVIGGPGTGKSVLALMRSRRHQQDGDDYLFLVWNKLLHQASRQLFGENLVSQQWQSWFMQLFRKVTGESVPLDPVANPTGWRKIDWDQVTRTLQQGDFDAVEHRPYLVIDEGQDMPPQFYQALICLGFENFFVVGDANQQLTEEHSNPTTEIAPQFLYEPQIQADGLPVTDDRGLPILARVDEKGRKEPLITLYQNYRNSYPIARLAQAFCRGDPGNPPADPAAPPAFQSSVNTPLLFEYQEHQFERLIARVVKMADLNPRRLIGIITPNNRVRKRYVDALNRSAVTLDHGRPAIQTYASGQPAQLDFNEGGIMVINAQACKGLEFDTVILADIDEHRCNELLIDQKKRLFYVMTARAIEKIILLKRAGRHCPVDPILPTDSSVLERR
ncbi:MAG: AAA family ATPase [Chromatiaceae bacterium]|nr:AAA family ATPase [Chromatiaceae bacterium]